MGTPVVVKSAQTYLKDLPGYLLLPGYHFLGRSTAIPPFVSLNERIPGGAQVVFQQFPTPGKTSKTFPDRFQECL
jgi:hypothetical protein